MARRGADEVVARELVVARDFDRIEASIHPLERVAGELIGGKLLVFTGTFSLFGIEVAVREMADFVREDRIEHRTNGVGVVDSHPLLKEAVEELLIVEETSAVAACGEPGLSDS